MTEGTSNFEGLALPRLGEYEQEQQDSTLDMVSLTGAASQSGDFIVCQNSTGGENFVVSSSGLFTPVVGEADLVLSSTTHISAMSVAVTNTGAFAQGADNAAFMVTGNATSVLNACYGYNADATGLAPTTFFLTSGTASPSYFMVFGATKAGVGAASDIGFFDSSHKLFSADCDTYYGVIKILAGSKCYHILSVPDTGSVAQ